MTGARPNGVATDGVHVNGQGEFCHVVRKLFRRKPLTRPPPAYRAAKTHRAKCTSTKGHHCILQRAILLRSI
jgi:hypothetical protein